MAGGEQRARRMKTDSIDAVASRFCAAGQQAGDIPDFQHFIPAARHQPRAVRAEPDCQDFVVMSMQGQQLALFAHIPEFHGFVAAGRSQNRAVGVKTQAVHRFKMPVQRTRRTFVFDIPDIDACVAAPRR